MTTSLKVPVENKIEKYHFSSLDRCDACKGASRAYVRFEKNGLDLLVCGHHYNKFMPEMVAQNWTIDNQLSILEDEIAAFNSKSKDSDF